MGLLQYIENIGIELHSGSELPLSDGSSALLLCNPTEIECGVAAEGSEQLIIVHTTDEPSCLTFNLGEGASLRVVELFLASSASRSHICQAADSRCQITSLVVGDCSADYVACVMNGMALHGGVIPACGTFFVFSDYMKPAIRMSALQRLHVIYVWTHDSFRVGEDGPTHQLIFK